MSFDWLSVLGGGAEWIWNPADDQFPGYRGPRVFFHAAEHLAVAGAALYGDSTAEAQGFVPGGPDCAASRTLDSGLTIWLGT